MSTTNTNPRHFFGSSVGFLRLASGIAWKPSGWHLMWLLAVAVFFFGTSARADTLNKLKDLASSIQTLQKVDEAGEALEHFTKIFWWLEVNGPAIATGDGADQLKGTFPADTNEVVADYIAEAQKLLTSNTYEALPKLSGSSLNLFKGTLPDAALDTLESLAPLIEANRQKLLILRSVEESFTDLKEQVRLVEQGMEKLSNHPETHWVWEYVKFDHLSLITKTPTEIAKQRQLTEKAIKTFETRFTTDLSLLGSVLDGTLGGVHERLRVLNEERASELNKKKKEWEAYEGKAKLLDELAGLLGKNHQFESDLEKLKVALGKKRARMDSLDKAAAAIKKDRKGVIPGLGFKCQGKQRHEDPFACERQEAFLMRAKAKKIFADLQKRYDEMLAEKAKVRKEESEILGEKNALESMLASNQQRVAKLESTVKETQAELKNALRQAWQLLFSPDLHAEEVSNLEYSLRVLQFTRNGLEP